MAAHPSPSSIRPLPKRYLTGIDLATTDLAFGFPVVRQETRRPIVGIVDDVKYASLIGDFEAAYYLVYGAGASRPNVGGRRHDAGRSDVADSGGPRPRSRSWIRCSPSTCSPWIRSSRPRVARQKLGMTLMLIFGGVALSLAAIGIYGVIAYASAERRGEVATRLALGATPANIFWLLVRHGRVMTAAGIVLGLGGAYAAGHLASTWLYAVQAWDPAILATALASVLVGHAGGHAACRPGAHRALDPAYALRSD